MGEASTLDEKITSQYYQLKLDDSRIKLIDTQKSLHVFLDEMDILESLDDQEFAIVGVDAEWKPTCATAHFEENSNQVALIQISTHQFVYLLDMVKLNEVMLEEDTRTFAQKFLKNKKIVKLGYGFTQDIKMLCEAFNCTNEEHDMFRQTVLGKYKTKQ